MKKSKPHFILVDDDSTNNLICKIIIKQLSADSTIEIFTDPLLALRYLKEEYCTNSPGKTILFLDINMPVISGWEFLNIYKIFNKNIKDSINIFILSSSIDQKDRNNAIQNPNVIDYLEKPLTKINAEPIINKYLALSM